MLHHALVPPRGLDEQSPFAKVVAAWFFDVDVLACLAGQNGRGGVPVVWGGNHHGVHRWVVQDAPQIGDRVLSAILSWIWRRRDSSGSHT